MTVDYKQFYSAYIDLMDVFLKDEKFFKSFTRLLKDSPSNIAFVKKQCIKTLETDWIEAIEKYLPSVDYCIRNPRKFIENREEILPIEISRNITVESIKHLAQHTNLISSIEGDKITPSKILNVFKDESYNTYENRFVNTLLNRLLLFVVKRYDKIKEAMLADDFLMLKIDQDITVNEHEKINVAFEIKSAYNTAVENELEKKDFKRVERLKNIVMEYSASEFINIMKDTAYVRPPITRTNAIMKNNELKDCLNLWLFIESYDKIGYAIDFIDTVSKPRADYINELHGLTAINYALFKYYTTNQDDDLIIRKVRRKKALVPKFVKDIYEQFTTEYNISEVEFRKIMDVQKINLKKKRAEDERKIKAAINTALSAEAKYKRDMLLLEKQLLKQSERNAKSTKRM